MPISTSLTHTRARSLSLLSLICGFVSTGCGDIEHPTTTTPLESRQVQIQEPSRASERHFRDAAVQVPEYGGHYYDEQANLVVWLTRADAVSNAREALAPQWDRDVLAKLSGRRGRFEVRIGTYTFRELEDFRSSIENDIFDLPGVVWLDLDEVRNRITVGIHVDSIAHGTSVVEQFMVSTEIPAGAWGVEPGSRIVRSSVTTMDEDTNAMRTGAGSDLRLYKLHLRAGFQIGYDSLGTPRACSIGMLMHIAAKPVALTAAHCSVEIGSFNYSYWDPAVAADSTIYGQPGHSGFGFELYDMPRWNCGASGGCIPADANVIEITRAMTDSIHFLSIANAVAGDHYEDDTVAPYQVVGEYANSTVGVDVFKVGRSTGKSAGAVHKTCVDYSDHPTVRCVDTASPVASAGDSGAPVFSIINFGSPEVILAGILSGRTYHWAGLHWDIAYSPMQEIRTHYGDLQPLIHY